MPRRSIAALLLGELAEERIALLRAQSANATTRGYVEALHDLPRPDLPHARERLQNRGYLHLADGVVALAGQHVGERELPRLELALELCPLPSRLGGLLESLLALFLRQDGKRHTQLLFSDLGDLGIGAGNPASIDTAVRGQQRDACTFTCGFRSSADRAEDGSRSAGRITRRRDRSTDDDVVGSGFDRLLWRLNPNLVVAVRSCRPDARDDETEFLARHLPDD